MCGISLNGNSIEPGQGAQRAISPEREAAMAWTLQMVEKKPATHTDSPQQR